ncbi:MAG: excinuclease ABC subunit UvrC [Lachnospiraceae bacterium]|jgi:excinuclease ABC subunit C|nr:excinuclease ABC subunit UvrC [Lachnospiraceae bacterium]
MFNIEEELKKLPKKPGVYLHHGENDEVIYVGKAKILSNRVKQYFQKGRSRGAKIDQMITHITRFEYIVTDSEVEALVLECNLIKEYRPKYNTMLMDDKSYPYIKVTTYEDFPRVLFSWRIGKDKSKYYGPYTNITSVTDTLDLIKKVYHIRSCNRNLPKDIGKERPCLYYHIHECEAPCQGYISKEEYSKKIQAIEKFLSGDTKDILSDLTEKMMECSSNLEFEKAGEYKDLINSVKKITEKQKMNDMEGGNRDIISIANEDEDAVVSIFFNRNGKIIGRDHFYLKVKVDDTKGDTLSVFIKQFYLGSPYIPNEIMIPFDVEDRETIESWLTSKSDHKVTLRIPKKGQKEKLVELATKNAELILKNDRDRLKNELVRTLGATKEIGDLLGIEHIDRIESYDISNISGFNSVGSMIVYEKGKPKKSDYRKFKIKSIVGPDDYGSMKEVLTRRFTHGLKELEEGKETSKFTVFPELILMDGGAGQVNIALEVLSSLDLEIPVAGMVKDDRHRTRALYFEGREIPIDIHSEGFKLLTRIQDEVHRFAITFHRELRSKGQVHSILDDIKGVGPKRRKELIKYFENIEAIKNSSVDDLSKVPSMDTKSAKAVYDFFHNSEE